MQCLGPSAASRAQLISSRQPYRLQQCSTRFYSMRQMTSMKQLMQPEWQWKLHLIIVQACAAMAGWREQAFKCHPHHQLESTSPWPLNGRMKSFQWSSPLDHS